MVVIRKPVQRSKNIVDRRGETRYAVQQAAVWADEERRRKAEFARMLQRLQERHQRALRQQQTRGR